MLQFNRILQFKFVYTYKLFVDFVVDMATLDKATNHILKNLAVSDAAAFVLVP